MKKQSSGILYFAIAALIALTIVVTFTIGRIQQGNTDVRTRAGITSTLTVTAVVEKIDESERTIRVSNLQFSGYSAKEKLRNLGDWTVTVPPSVNLTSLYSGKKITFTINSKSMDARTKTVTAVIVY